MSADKRRARGDGALYQDGDRWVGLLDLGRGPDGRRRRRKVTGRTRSEVTRRMRELVAERAKGADVGRRPPTVAELARDWLAKAAPQRKSEATLERVRRRIDQHVIAGVGRHRVDQLGVEHVEDWLTAEAAAGQARRTIADYRADLRQVLTWAQRRSLVVRNVAAIAELPLDARASRSKRSLTVAALDALLAALDGDRLGPYFTLLVELGVRPGEADALTWDDVDAGVVRVRRAMKRGEGGDALGIGEPKTLGSRRNLALTSRAAAALRQRKVIQAAEHLAAGPAWSTDERWAGLVFTTEVGTPMRPSNVRRSFAAACRRAGIEPLTPYELRHTAASLLVDAGATAYAVADQLGHTTTRMLDAHYRHRVADVVDTAVVIERQRGAR